MTIRKGYPATLWTDPCAARTVTWVSVDELVHGAPEVDWWPVDSYGPVAVAAQVVGDKWTLLVVRELLEGITRFNEIHRGLPGLSRSLLASRLRQLEHAGLVDRVALGGSSRHYEYILTPAGAGLSTVIEALGAWTRDWRLQPAAGVNSDAPTVLWRFFRSLDLSALPRAGIGIEFRFLDADPARGWIRAHRDRPRAGLGHPEGDVDLVVAAAPLVLDDLWRGVRQCDPAIESGDIRFDGPSTLARSFRRWFAARPRPAP